MAYVLSVLGVYVSVLGVRGSGFFAASCFASEVLPSVAFYLVALVLGIRWACLPACNGLRSCVPLGAVEVSLLQASPLGTRTLHQAQGVPDTPAHNEVRSRRPVAP